MIYSWHKEHWVRLLERLDRMPHAILLAGPQGGGKTAFAQALAARLLCEEAYDKDEACGKCPSCNWFANGNHPDFRLIEPGSDEPDEQETETDSASQKKKSEQIRINQIRALESLLGVGTHRQRTRVIIIQPAEAMNQATANALLKMLEEPSSSTLFLMITNNKRRLLPTILSRCQTLNFPKPSAEQSLAWLRETGTAHAADLLAHAGGLPLAAVAEAGNWDRLDSFYQDLTQLDQVGPVSVAGRWEAWLKEDKDGESGIDKRTLVIWLQKWIFDLVSFKVCGLTVFHTHKLHHIQSSAKLASTTALIDCYNELLRIKAVSQHPLNPRLFLEDVLSRYARAALSGR